MQAHIFKLQSEHVFCRYSSRQYLVEDENELSSLVNCSLSKRLCFTQTSHYHTTEEHSGIKVWPNIYISPRTSLGCLSANFVLAILFRAVNLVFRFLNDSTLEKRNAFSHVGKRLKPFGHIVKHKFHLTYMFGNI